VRPIALHSVAYTIEESVKSWLLELGLHEPYEGAQSCHHFSEGFQAAVHVRLQWPSARWSYSEGSCGYRSCIGVDLMGMQGWCHVAGLMQQIDVPWETKPMC
jgi:hypothetical protein